MPNDEDEVAARPPGPDHAMTDTAAVINQFNTGGRPLFGMEAE